MLGNQINWEMGMKTRLYILKVVRFCWLNALVFNLTTQFFSCFSQDMKVTKIRSFQKNKKKGAWMKLNHP